MENNFKKCIINDYECNSYFLLLTNSQIELLKFLIEKELAEIDYLILDDKNFVEIKENEKE